MDFPFTEIQINEETFIREFSSKVDEMELIWHRDKENRYIKVLEGNGWKFQFDEELPIDMTNNSTISIPKGKIHRIIKGHGPLKIELHKLND